MGATGVAMGVPRGRLGRHGVTMRVAGAEAQANSNVGGLMKTCSRGGTRCTARIQRSFPLVSAAERAQGHERSRGQRERCRSLVARRI